MYDLTIIIPTFKEEANIAAIIREVDTVFSKNAINGEILVVDDNSPDRTIPLVKELQRTKPNLSLVVRKNDPGLSQSVVEGFRKARSDILLVIDADLSHPPSYIRRFFHYILQSFTVTFTGLFIGISTSFQIRARPASFNAYNNKLPHP